MTLQTIRVLQVFLGDVTNEFAGAEIARGTRLLSGTLYPILLRLESAGWLTSKWEKVDPAKVGRPRRRLYRLTAVGQTRARNVLCELLGTEVPA